MSVSTIGIRDPDVKRTINALVREIDALKARLEGVVSQEGTFIANLGLNATKTTTAGEKTVTAGAITILDDFDDITDGSTYKKLAGVDGSNQATASSLASNSVEEAKINASAVTEGKIGTGAVTNTKIGTGAVDTAELANGAVDNDKVAAGADIDPSKVLISGAVNLDDWRDLSDPTKILGTQIAADTITTTQIDGDAVTAVEIEENGVNGHHFVESVVDEYQGDMGSLQSDAQWDALTT